MKLLTEVADFNLIENQVILDEKTGKKDYYVSGIFMQSEKVNKNGRYYKKHLMEREVNKYQKKIQENESMGELNHADSIDVNYERATHIIKELALQGNDVYGKAKILDTTIGKGIVKPLLDEGIKVGMSSRALGSLEESLDGEYKLVGEDFNLLMVDIVSNPSAHDAKVALMENSEWIIENGLIVEKKLDEIQKSIHSLKKPELKEGIARIFQEFINEVAKKKSYYEVLER
jgi:hypothetical protein